MNKRPRNHKTHAELKARIHGLGREMIRVSRLVIQGKNKREQKSTRKNLIGSLIWMQHKIVVLELPSFR